MGLGNRVRIRMCVLPAVCGRSNTEKESIKEITLTPTLIPQTNYLVPTHGRNNHFVRIRVSVGETGGHWDIFNILLNIWTLRKNMHA